MASGHLRAGNVAYVLYGGESIYVLKSAPDKGHRTLVGEGDIRWCMELDEIPADVRYDDEVFILGWTALSGLGLIGYLWTLPSNDNHLKQIYQSMMFMMSYSYASAYNYVACCLIFMIAM